MRPHPNSSYPGTMTSTEHITVDQVIEDAVRAIDVAGAAKAIDIGGADGSFVIELVRKNPRLVGLVLERSPIAPTVVRESIRRSVQGLFIGINGDFFDQVPPADIYLLKNVLREWTDQPSQQILTTIRAAMKPGTRLYVVEKLADQDEAATDGTRTIEDLQRLFLAAGLGVVQLVPLRSAHHLIQLAVPAHHMVDQ